MQYDDIHQGGLHHIIERHLKDYFDAHDNDLPAAGLYERIMREVERPLIEQTLRRVQGNQIRAAALLGLNRNTLRKKMQDLAILPKRSRK